MPARARAGPPLPRGAHLDLVEHLRVGGGGHKGDGQALGAEAAGAADAMQVCVRAVAVLLVCKGQGEWAGWGQQLGRRQSRAWASGVSDRSRHEQGRQAAVLSLRHGK